MNHIDITAGALAASQVRAELKRLRFLGHEVEWLETCPVWCERHFTVGAEDSVLKGLEKWMRSVNARRQG